jgi:hypothetical protein
MSIKAKSASVSTASSEDGDVEIQADTVDTESTPLLTDQSVEEASVKSGPIWSATSLGPGFIWIQTGSSPPILGPQCTSRLTFLQQSSAMFSSLGSMGPSLPQLTHSSARPSMPPTPSPGSRPRTSSPQPPSNPSTAVSQMSLAAEYVSSLPPSLSLLAVLAVVLAPISIFLI